MNVKVKAVAGAAAVAAVAAVCAYILSRVDRKMPEADISKKPTQIADFQPAEAGSLPEIQGSIHNGAAEKDTAVSVEKTEFVKRPGAMQLPDGQVLTFPAPKEGETRKVYAYGHMYECDHLGNFRDITPRELFHTAFEGNFLALAVEGRRFIPAFLTGLDEAAVRRMLEKPYEPIGDETEEEKAQLKAYDDMRAAALQYMDEGGSFDDFVMDFANYERKSRETNAYCLRQVMTLCKEGRLAEAKETAAAAARLMEQQGLRPFRLPAHVKEAFDAME